MTPAATSKLFVRQKLHEAPNRNRPALSSLIQRIEPAMKVFTASRLFWPAAIAAAGVSVPLVSRCRLTLPTKNVTAACPVTVPAVCDVKVTLHMPVPCRVPFGDAQRSPDCANSQFAPLLFVSDTPTGVPAGAGPKPVTPSPPFAPA